MTPSSVYDIDFAKLVRWLSPNKLRKLKALAWLGVLVSPVVFLYQAFLSFRTAKLYELSITPQVCYLEKLLRDRYDFVLRRIYIIDGFEQSALYVYQDAEDHPIDLYTGPENLPVTLYTDGEINGSLSDDFIVMVPSDIVFDATEMRSLIMKFRLPGMRFKIQTY